MQGLKARWVLPEPTIDEAAEPFKNLAPIVAQVLHARGLAPEDVGPFLAPDVSSMHSPLLMRGMREAVRRIRAALGQGERIAVYGDFDVDGVTATVLVYEALTALGGVCQVYVPHRVAEGYGLNREALAALRADNVSLVITVDCGVSSADEVEYARSIGLDIVITDHHVPPARLPDAVAVVNPRQPLCPYPFKNLAGVGVAFKLASALADGAPDAQRLRRDLLDLVTVGTIADLVPLNGENRVLVRAGLPLLANTRRVGLRVLLRQAGLEHSALVSNDVGYKIGPRLNAAGRVDHAMVGCRLLMTTDLGEAEDLAARLEEKNAERKRLTAVVIDEARGRIGPSPRESALVIDDPAWPGGVIGLVAGRLSTEYSRPVLVIARTAPDDEDDEAALDHDDLECRGSGRTVPGFNLIEALTSCSDLLIKFGGHPQAAGFSIRARNIPLLRERIAALATAALHGEMTQTITIDAEIGGRGFGADDVALIHEQLDVLEPFGMGNQQPVLLWRNARVAECRTMGDTRQHLRLSIAVPDGTVSAVAFNQADGAGPLPRGSVVDIVCTLEYNDWNGRTTTELHVKDLAVHGASGHAQGSSSRLSAPSLSSATGLPARRDGVDLS